MPAYIRVPGPYCPFAHPMSGYGFSFDDILEDVKEAGREFEREYLRGGKAAKDLAQKAAASALQKAALNPDVQKTIAEQAEKAALEKAVLSLQEQRKQLMADLSKFTDDPGAFIQESPGKAALYVGVPLAAAFLAWRLLK